jgi:hypothetical protein
MLCPGGFDAFARGSLSQILRTRGEASRTNLESDKRLNIQLRLDSSIPTGEARQAGREDIESLSAGNESERPAKPSRPTTA